MTAHQTEGFEFAGVSVLVVDDDYYQAADTGQIFEQEGATVIGPFGQEDQALARIEKNKIDCAVVDLNLGAGASFAVPRLLKSRNIPTLIVTGYDEQLLPPDLQGTACVEKPVAAPALRAALARVLRAGRPADERQRD